MQRWNVVQHELIPELRNDVGTMTQKLEKVKDNPGVEIIHRDKRRSLTGQQRRWLKRRQTVDPAIGHLKSGAPGQRGFIVFLMHFGGYGTNKVIRFGGSCIQPDGLMPHSKYAHFSNGVLMWA